MKENLIKAAKNGARTFGRLLKYSALFVLVMAAVYNLLAWIPFVVLGVYLLCAGLLYYKKKNDILAAWVYMVVLLCALNLDFWGDEAMIGCLVIMLLLLIYQAYARVAKKKMLAVWWFAPHTCLVLELLCRALREVMCRLSCPPGDILGTCRYKCFWEF